MQAFSGWYRWITFSTSCMQAFAASYTTTSVGIPIGPSTVNYNTIQYNCLDNCNVFKYSYFLSTCNIYGYLESTFFWFLAYDILILATCTSWQFVWWWCCSLCTFSNHIKELTSVPRHNILRTFLSSWRWGPMTLINSCHTHSLVHYCIKHKINKAFKHAVFPGVSNPTVLTQGRNRISFPVISKTGQFSTIVFASTYCTLMTIMTIYILVHFVTKPWINESFGLGVSFGAI